MVPAPPSLNATGDVLVAIRAYCRFPPSSRPDSPRCTRQGQPLYFYDVASARCRAFQGGYCGRSRNRFLSREACMEACVVDAQSLEEEQEERKR